MFSQNESRQQKLTFIFEYYTQITFQKSKQMRFFFRNEKECIRKIGA